MNDAKVRAVHFLKWSTIFPRRSYPPQVVFELSGTAERDNFLEYLLSDDTRLPAHPLLDCHGADPNDYDTYVGEEVWESQTDNAQGEADERKRFDSFVVLVADAIRQLTQGESSFEKDFGVVIAGGYCVADDISWVLSSQSLVAIHVREVFAVFRLSTKLLADIERQKNETSSPIVRLTKFLDFHECQEFRVFIGMEPSWSCPVLLGICQRKVDQVFTELVSWDQTTNNGNFCFLRLFFIEHMGDFCKEICTGPLIVAVDCVFESQSLPVVVLGISTIVAKNDATLMFEDNVPFFRLFRSEGELRRQHDHFSERANEQTVFIATTQEDLCGDMSGLKNRCQLPFELQHPEECEMTEELKQLLTRIQESQKNNR